MVAGMKVRDAGTNPAWVSVDSSWTEYVYRPELIRRFAEDKLGGEVESCGEVESDKYVTTYWQASKPDTMSNELAGSVPEVQSHL